MKWLLLFIPIMAFAGFSGLPEGQKYQYMDKKVITRKLENKKTIKPKGGNREMQKIAIELMERDQKIEELLQAQEKKLNVKAKEFKINALTRVRGVVLNSVLAMNVRPTTFIVKLDTKDSNLEEGELRCSGICFEKRVPATCDLLVVDDHEYSVDVKVWDLDGAEGILADYYYSGEEKTFLTSGFASFFTGVMDAAKDRIITPYGDAQRNNAKNKILGGLMGVSENAKEKISESAEKNISIGFINAGKEVLVFFNQSLNFKEATP